MTGSVKTGLFTVMVVAMFALSTAAIVASSDVSADSGFYITDGKGNTIHFDGPVDHIITIGVGVTATVLQLGYGEKIVVADKYSSDNKAKVFDQLRQRISEGKAVADGTIYSSGVDALKSNVIDAADTEKGGVFDKYRDVMILTGSDTYLINNGLLKYFQDNGFRVLVWNDIVEYADVIVFAEKMSLIVSGSISPEINKMRNVVKVIDDKLKEEKVVDKTEAFYLTYSGNVFKVGNVGSIATSMIVAAGGNAITIDTSRSESTYERNLTEIIATYGTDVVIFADSANIVQKPDRLEELEKQVGRDVKIVELDPLWNNYSIESMQGVWTMACAMYPDYFQGDVPEVDTSSGNDALVMFIAGVVLSIVTAGVVIYLMRKG
ncbi:MAG: ABC transporter substrate-binding protein [Candidatus Methanomethylophilaceae archaeon]|nr:ABC transporter substrate-binding protein [Candidatus Methanomethylophilaceae archaeon]